MEAELEVGFQVLVERYTSQVFLSPPNSVRSRVADSSLFDHLDSTWTMEPGPTPHTCWLSFHVDFAFRSQLHGYLADIFFSEVVKQMSGAFEGRCATLYGPSSLLVPPRPAAGRSGSAAKTHAVVGAHGPAHGQAGGHAHGHGHGYGRSHSPPCGASGAHAAPQQEERQRQPHDVGAVEEAAVAGAGKPLSAGGAGGRSQGAGGRL